MALRNRRTTGQLQGNTGQLTTGAQTYGQPAYGQSRAAGTAFATPMEARERQSNELLSVIAFGDIPGNSPSYLVVDDAGISTWLPLTDVQITDARIVPMTQERRGLLLDQIGQQLQQQQVVNG